MLNKNTNITLGELGKIISNDDLIAVITYLDEKIRTKEQGQKNKISQEDTKPKGVWGVFDGGAKPSKIYGSFYISDGDVIETFDFKHEHMTNNVAEYLALIKILEYIIDNQISSPTIYGDSMLVINQVNGSWKVKASHLIPLRQEVVALLNQIGTHTLEWRGRKLALKYLGH